jgi:hypothetical protein
VYLKYMPKVSRSALAPEKVHGLLPSEIADLAKSLPATKRYELFRDIAGEAASFLRGGTDREVVMDYLRMIREKLSPADRIRFDKALKEFGIDVKEIKFRQPEYGLTEEAAEALGEGLPDFTRVPEVKPQTYAVAGTEPPDPSKTKAVAAADTPTPPKDTTIVDVATGDESIVVTGPRLKKKTVVITEPPRRTYAAAGTEPPDPSRVKAAAATDTPPPTRDATVTSAGTRDVVATDPTLADKTLAGAGSPEPDKTMAVAASAGRQPGRQTAVQTPEGAQVSAQAQIAVPSLQTVSVSVPESAAAQTAVQATAPSTAAPSTTTATTVDTTAVGSPKADTTLDSTMLNKLRDLLTSLGEPWSALVQLPPTELAVVASVPVGALAQSLGWPQPRGLPPDTPLIDVVRSGPSWERLKLGRAAFVLA